MEVTLMYMGLVETNKGKLIHKYVEIVNEQISDRMLLFTKPLGNIHVIGQCMIATTEDNQTFKQNVSYIDLKIMSTQEIINRIGEQSAIKLKLRNVTKLKETASQHQINEILRPLKVMYKSLDYEDRQYVLAKMIEFITR